MYHKTKPIKSKKGIGIRNNSSQITLTDIDIQNNHNLDKKTKHKKTGGSLMVKYSVKHI